MRSRKSIYQELIRIELNILEPDIRKLINDPVLFSKVMFEVRRLQPRIARRLVTAQSHLPSDISNHQEPPLSEMNKQELTICDISVTYLGSDTPIGQMCRFLQGSEGLLIQPFENRMCNIIVEKLRQFNPVLEDNVIRITKETIKEQSLLGKNYLIFLSCPFTSMSGMNP